MARYTSIASVLALSGQRLVGALTTAAAAYSSGTSALAVVLAAASEHDECTGFVDADGKGFYRWYTVNSGVKCLSKGRVSQLVTFGRWLDAEPCCWFCPCPTKTDALFMPSWLKASFNRWLPC